MSQQILVNAKWRVHTSTGGVQRYAEGLWGGMQAAGMGALLVGPPYAGRFRATIWEQRTLPRMAKAGDVLICPANMAPVRLDPEVRLVVVLHCLRYLFHPKSYSPAFVRWYERMIPRVIERADRLLTVSHAQADEIISAYPHARGKLGVMPPGLDPAFRPGLERDPRAPAEPYLICLANSTPAKNLQVLLRALETAPASFPTLVIAGISPPELEVIRPPSIRDRVIALGHVNDPSRVASLLANAQALLAPSRYESFGLPCLEAMGCATPVIACELPAHRWVCADAALYADPDDPGAWSDAIAALLGRPGLQVGLARAGMARSRLFTWDRSVAILEREIGSLDQSVEDRSAEELMAS